jgi:hypothetical protein
MGTETQILPKLRLISLVGGIVNDAKALLTQEMALIKLEVRCELLKAKTAVITLGIAIGVAATGGMLLALMLVHMLAVLTVVPLWGCYGFVGFVFFALGGVLLAAGKNQAEKLDAVPQPTLVRLKESKQWLAKPTTFKTR